MTHLNFAVRMQFPEKRVVRQTNLTYIGVDNFLVRVFTGEFVSRVGWRRQQSGTARTRCQSIKFVVLLCHAPMFVGAGELSVRVFST
jgi:hypothetical protein